MTSIRTIAPSQAGGRLAQVYREIRGEVPRVPELLRAFSLRPETMEAIHRSWLAMMWSPRIPRQLKEMVAVMVAVDTRCDYCADSHLVTMLAAGTDPAKARSVRDRGHDAEGLGYVEKAAARAAHKLTVDPRGYRDQDRSALASAWPHEDERVELLVVIAAFNGVARLALVLGVPSEIPAPLLRFDAGRRGAIGLLARLASFSMDLGEKAVPGLQPEAALAALDDLLLEGIGFSQVPTGLSRLVACPEILSTQLRLLRTAAAVLPRDRWARVGLVVSRLVGCEAFASECAGLLRSRGEDPSEAIAASEGAASGLGETELASIRFARDFTLHAHTITRERLREMRRAGLSDGAILDLAYVCAVFNGFARLVIALAPV